MKIAVMGSGGIGGYIGGRLAMAGSDVTFIARGAHLDAIRLGGLSVRGAEEFNVSGASATDTPSEIGGVDLVLFCVKLYDTESAANAIAPIVSDKTIVLTLQNGIESISDVGAIVGADAMLGGAAYFPANNYGTGRGYLSRKDRRPSAPCLRRAGPRPQRSG